MVKFIFLIKEEVVIVLAFEVGRDTFLLVNLDCLLVDLEIIRLGLSPIWIFPWLGIFSNLEFLVVELEVDK